MLSLFIPIGILIAASFLVLSSVAMHFFYFQFLWVILGMGLVALFTFLDWRTIFSYRWIVWGLYILSVLLLIFVWLKGPAIRNIHGWIVLGPLRFQPVEFAKIALILVYAEFFSRRHVVIAHFKNILVSFAFFVVPAFLTALQPDLGNAVILFGIWFGSLLVSGLPPRRILLAFVIFALGAVLLWSHGLKAYQRERIVGVFYPQSDAQGINYSTIQSKIAIGSGGAFGKGYRQGTQTQLHFLSVPESDFALAVFLEEWGWVPGLILIGAFLFLVFQILKIGIVADKNFEKFVALGTAMVYGFQFLINAGSTIGLLPVVGVPFPFVSYGGSSLLMSF